jgi:hypothetical protein
MNPYPMRAVTNRKFRVALERFYEQLAELDDFPQTWIDGFYNVIRFGESAHPDDNPYEPGYEEPLYSNYRDGARAAESLLRAAQRQEGITP